MCGEEHLRNKQSFLLRPRHADFYARGYCSLVSSIDYSYQTNLKWPQLRSTRSSLRQCIILSRGGRHRNHELGYGRQMTPTPRKSVWLLLPLVRSTYIGRIRVSYVFGECNASHSEKGSVAIIYVAVIGTWNTGASVVQLMPACAGLSTVEQHWLPCSIFLSLDMSKLPTL